MLNYKRYGAFSYKDLRPFKFDKLEFVYLLLFDELYKLPNATDIAAQQIDIPALFILPINNNIPPTKVSIKNII